MDFADRLKQFRSDHGMSQGQFAKLTGIPPSTVSNWENRVRGIPDARRHTLEDFMREYATKTPQKGSNSVTKRSTGSTVSSNLEADATRLGLAVFAVRRAEIKLEKLAPEYEAAKADVERARADLEEIETSSLSTIG